VTWPIRAFLIICAAVAVAVLALVVLIGNLSAHTELTYLAWAEVATAVGLLAVALPPAR
jgi:hypothetical protein